MEFTLLLSEDELKERVENKTKEELSKEDLEKDLRFSVQFAILVAEVVVPIYKRVITGTGSDRLEKGISLAKRWMAGIPFPAIEALEARNACLNGAREARRYEDPFAEAAALCAAYAAEAACMASQLEDTPEPSVVLLGPANNTRFRLETLETIHGFLSRGAAGAVAVQAHMAGKEAMEASDLVGTPDLDLGEILQRVKAGFETGKSLE